MPVKRDNKKTALDTYVEKMEAIADKFVPKPYEIPAYVPPEPIRFSNDPGTLEIEELVNELLQVLDGRTMEEIRFASAIVEQYVTAQSKGQMMSVPFPYRP